MIVYVETNFVLEMAYEQEESGSCDSILALAESGAIELAMPAFSIAESYETLTRRSRRRNEYRERLNREVRELARSTPYARITESWNELSPVLRDSVDAEKERLDAVLTEVLDCATIIPTGAETLRRAIDSLLAMLAQFANPLVR